MKNKRTIIYFTTLFLAVSGVTLKLSKEKSNEISKNILEYTTNFTNDDFQIVAHRGFSSLNIENTKEALTLADNQEYIDFIELDARMTHDGEIVISHNNKVNISLFRTLKISDTTYQELQYKTLTYYNFPQEILFNSNIYEKYFIAERKFSKNNKEYQIPNLLEAISVCKNKEIILDIKFSKNFEEFADKLIKQITEIDSKKIYLQSSNLLGIYYLQENTNYPCFAIFDKKEDLQYTYLFDNICLRKNLVTNDYIEKLLKEDKIVSIWTINTKKELAELTEEIKANYKDILYVTDYPDYIATELSNIEKNKVKRKDY